MQTDLPFNEVVVPDPRIDAGSEVTLHRCRGCGDWSHAKRRPSTHVRSEPKLDETGERIGTRQVVCGPFETWKARPADPSAPRPVPVSVGTVIADHDWVEDPNAGIPAPWEPSF